MGLIRDVATAGIEAALPGAGAAGGKRNKRSSGSTSGATDTDDPGAPGQGASDSSQTSDPSYIRRFGQNLAKRTSDKSRL